MKEVFKNGFALFGKIIIVNLMCFFIAVSMVFISTAAFTEDIGYKAFGVKKDSEQQVELYEHYYVDGDDNKRAEYEAEGYTITESKIRSSLSKTGNRVFLSVTQVFCLLMTWAFIYPTYWRMGTKDSNLVYYKHKREDKLKGFKCGLLAIAPSVLVIMFLAVAKFSFGANFPVGILKFFNSSFYTFFELIINGATVLKELSLIRVLLLAAVLFIVPAISGIAYLLGYKNISIGEKFIYKKNKTN